MKAGLNVIKDGAIDEARDFNKGEKYYGGTWEVRNTPVYLDYSGDVVYTDLSSQASKRKLDLNQAFKMAQDSKTFFDNDSGEEIPIMPVKTPSSQIVVFKPKP